LSRKELSRVDVMGRLKADSLQAQEAAEFLGLSYRQGKRVWARYRGVGAQALQHWQPRARLQPSSPRGVSPSGAGSGAPPLCGLRTNAGGGTW